jgi:hypothetical protein
MGGAWYVGSARWRRNWRHLLVLGLLAGVIGGAVLGALTGARRSSSAYDRLVRAAGAPHEVLFVFDKAPAISKWLESAPGIDRYAAGAGMIGRRAPQQDWYSLDAPYERGRFPEHAVLERGRMPREDRTDEVFITLRTSRNTGLDVGDTIAFRAYDASQTEALLSNPWTVPKGETVKVKVVGVARDPSDAQLSQTIKLIFGTPAFAQAHASSATFTMILVWLKGGKAAEPAFESRLAAFSRTQPGSSAPLDVVPSREDATAADHSSTAVVTGLLIFALVAALAGVVTIIQSVRRSLTPADEEEAVLRALGAGRADRATALFIASVPYLVVGTAIAVAISYALSPLFPLGATRALEPAPGLRADVPALVIGGLAWFLLLAVLTVAIAWLGAAPRVRRTRSSARSRARELGRAANAQPTTVGVRFALQPGTRRTALQRSALAGVIIAVVGVVSCVVFARSTTTFVDTPARYGIDFDASLELPNDTASTILDQLTANHDLAAVAASHSGTIDVEGRRVTAWGVDARKGDIRPTLRTGALPVRDDEIALGPKLLDGLHKHIGDRVVLNTGEQRHPLKIVGTALSPTSESNAFNEEAILTPDAVDTYADFPAIGALVRARPDANVDAVVASLDARYPYGVSDESRAHAPGPVRNLQQVERLPLVLALFFAFLGAAAIAQSIFMTARERRRDLSVLRVLGYTRRQTGAVLRGVAAGVAVVALAFGIPIGVVVGRFGWRAVADGLAVAPAVEVPPLAITLVVLGLIVFALLVALAPAHVARRRTPGAALRAE